MISQFISLVIGKSSRDSRPVQALSSRNCGLLYWYIMISIRVIARIRIFPTRLVLSTRHVERPGIQGWVEGFRDAFDGLLNACPQVAAHVDKRGDTALIIACSVGCVFDTDERLQQSKTLLNPPLCH
jgi:hypothetical protein